ncbi:MAG: HD domain-containing protein [Nitrospirae bacterium]|nr:HD domain-containing protein [Nitrospirota bacterium]
MDQNELILLKDWFADYCASFSLPTELDQRNIAIKRDHTHEVCLNAVRIAEDLGLIAPEARLSEAIALFHDVGRFSQYQQYKTFDDSISVNHAVLGTKVILENNVLAGLPKQEQELIIRSVTLHNVFTLPGGLDERSLRFARLIRDADKLDILRVVIEYFEQDEGSRAEAVALGLPDVPGKYSPEVLACLVRGEMARKDALTTLNDFKLLQLAWLYDLNFTCSLRMVVERDYIRKIAEMLPRNEEIAGAIEIMREYVSGRLRSR